MTMEVQPSEDLNSYNIAQQQFDEAAQYLADPRSLRRVASTDDSGSG